jgi:5'-deoxynucleotidase YfbR-like HD superfamily hydrolase
MDKMKELFEKMINITYQAQIQGEIGMETDERLDKVVKEYEEYCNQEERRKLVLEAKDQLDTVYKDLSENNLESVFNKLNKVDEYLNEIQKYNSGDQKEDELQNV